MTGSKMTSATLADLRAACERGESLTDVAKVRAASPYVWDGQDEDDRPLTTEEMRAGIEKYRGKRRCSSDGDTVSATIPFDRDVLAAFHASGSGWQMRINAALREWLQTHSPV